MNFLTFILQFKK